MKFTTQSVSKLIKACKENGVTELKLGDFSLSFKPPTREVEPSLPATIPDENSQDPKALEEVELIDEVSNLEDDEAMMLLADPVEFESRLASGDLVDEKMHN